MKLDIRDIRQNWPDFSLNIPALTVQSGELLTLLGPSGCGKTSTLRIIAGFAEGYDGAVVLGNRDITALPPEQRRIGVVFQDYALFPHLTVARNIAYGLRRRFTLRPGLSASEQERVRQLLRLVRLEGFGDRSVRELSGGEKQRVALARALAPKPALLLLDEPLSALDVQLREHLRNEIRRIQQKIGLTTIYVTHDQEEALAVSDRIALFNQGNLVQAGPPRQLYHEPESLFAAGFIGRSNLLNLSPGTAHGAPALFWNGQYAGRPPERAGYDLSGHGLSGHNLARRGLSGQEGSRREEIPRLFFRPEALQIDKGASETAGPALRFRAKVSSREYRGGHYRLRAELPSGESVLMIVSDREGPAAGEILPCILPLEQCRILYSGEG